MPTNKKIKKPVMSEARIRRQIRKYKITLKKVTKKVLTKKQKPKTVKKVSKKNRNQTGYDNFQSD